MVMQVKMVAPRNHAPNGAEENTVLDVTNKFTLQRGSRVPVT